MIAEAASIPDPGFIRKFAYSIWSAGISPAEYTLRWCEGNRRDYLSPAALFVALFALINTVMLSFGLGAPSSPGDAAIDNILNMFAADFLEPQVAAARANPDGYVRKLQFVAQILPSLVPALFIGGAAIALAGVKRWSVTNSVTLGLVEGIFQQCLFAIGMADDIVMGSQYGSSLWVLVGLLVSVSHGAWHIVTAAKLSVWQGVLRAALSGVIALLGLILLALISAFAALFPLPLVQP